MADIKVFGGFRVCPSGCSMEDKWFAEKLEDAVEWGRRFYFDQNVQIFYVVTASIAPELARKMFYHRNLDNIGNAICVGEDFLDQIRPLNAQLIKR